jgi:hypothetical protein
MDMMNVCKVIRSAAVALIAAATFAGTTQAANAVPPRMLADELAELWTAVLQTPSDENPFNSNARDPITCWDLGANIVAPFGASPEGVASCTVKPGTRIFVAASSVECSTFEGTSEADLVECARATDTVEPTVTLDGRPLALTEVETSVLSVALAEDNILGLPAGTEGQFAAHGWVTLLHPLTPGTHTIEITTDSAPPIVTTIEVVPPSQA